MGRWARGMLVVAIAVALVGTGCPKKAHKGEPGAGAGGLEGEALGGAGGKRGSLADYAAGRPGDRGTGPLKDVIFGFDSFEVDAASRQTLQQNAAWLKDNAKVRIELEGHCDERGTSEYNLALGAKRAASAKTYLVSLGVAADRITTISYGEELPLCREHNESCWQQNRRAHSTMISNE